MGYDTKYQWSWLTGDEDEPLSDKIKDAFYASIYDEAHDADVTEDLLHAWTRQRLNEDKKPLIMLQHDEAAKYCRDMYVATSIGLWARRKLEVTEEYLDEVFEYPLSLQFTKPIPKAVLKSVASRMAQCDLVHHINLAKAYAVEKTG